MKNLYLFSDLDRRGITGKPLILIITVVILVLILFVFVRTALRMHKIKKALPFDQIKKSIDFDKIPDMIGKAMAEREAEKNLPQQTAAARCVTKRSNVRGMSFTHTNYFICFELDSGERIELWTEGNQYGLIAEGDRGTLTYQGRHLISFTR